MNTYENKKRLGISLILLALFVVAGVSHAPMAMAQIVELRPGYISGTIEIVGQTITATAISASGPWGYASTSTTSGSYTLTVNTPQGSSAEYTVSAFSNLNTGRLTFPSQSVTVSENTTTVANLALTPGYIQASVTPTSGTVSRLYLSSSINGGSAIADGPGTSITFPVVPATNITVQGTAYFTDGKMAALGTRTVSVDAGEIVMVSWEVTPPQPSPTVGTIAGMFQFNGPPADRHIIYASGPSSRSQTLSGNGPYTFTDLVPGKYGLGANSLFNNTTYLSYPNSSFNPPPYPAYIVTGGATTIVDFSADAAFITGTLTLTGTKSLSQTNSARIGATGVGQETDSLGGYAETAPNRQTGVYNLIVTPGSWKLLRLKLGFYDVNPSSFLNEELSFYDYVWFYNPIAVTAGQAATRNLTYGTGTVTVTFRVVGGLPLTGPYLTGNCFKYDENNQVRSYYSFFSLPSPDQTNVTEGKVTFVGMEGTCSVQAYAAVGGSFTKFGDIGVDVVPGATQGIDIGGPSLTVTFPEPEYVTSNPTITVTGIASDDVAVGSVTVNDLAAGLIPPAPASAVTFSATIDLNRGPNQVQTIATDTSGKQSSDTRTVYRDEGPPTLSWTPADGAITSNADIMITGTANDDAGIKSIAVNGQPVALQPTGNGNEVAFSVPLVLADGDNFITVTATDVSNRYTPQTHKVTLTSDTTPPVIAPTVAPGPNAAGWNNTNVTVSWTVSDPESGIASTSGCGTTALGTETPGTTLTCSATNGVGLTNSASVTVKIDKTPPIVNASRTPGSNASGWNNTDVSVTFTASDAVSGVNGASSYTIVVSQEGANQSVSYTFTDMAGNSTTSTLSGINIDKTSPNPPTAAVSPAPNTAGWNNTDVTVSFTSNGDAGAVQSGGVTCTGPTNLSSETAGTVVSGTCTDAAGNTSAATSVTVKIDKTPPVISGLPAAGTCTLWPPNHKLVQVAMVTADVGLSGPVSLVVTGTSNEPENGLGDGDTAPDIVITGGTVLLRAERSGTGTGRIYTITAIATDGAGNTTTTAAICTVPHDKRK